MYDVIVIGAGPAGATTAKILSENGFKVLIVERMELPRYKSCSGVLIKKSMDMVKRYFYKDVPLNVMCNPIENHGMIFTDDKGKEFSFQQDGLNIWRSSFDNWLTQNAVEVGAELRDCTSALSCEPNGDYLSVQLHSTKSYIENSKYVVDCEGVTSVIKRKSLKISPKFITTFQTFNEGFIDLDPHYFYAYLQPELSEYDAWFNVKDNMLILGVAVKNTDTIPIYYDEFVKYMEEKHKLSITDTIKQERWLMPHIQPGCSIDYGMDRLFFAGEVAGFLNPMGEGISSGMESGYSIATSIAEHFDDPDIIFAEYKKKTEMLKIYMQRQWHFVSNMADTFKDMNMISTLNSV